MQQYPCPNQSNFQNLLTPGKAEGQKKLWHGHVTAVTVSPEYRRLGVASNLMAFLEEVSQDIYNAYFVDLFVRVSNQLAQVMYNGLQYSVYRQVRSLLVPHILFLQSIAHRNLRLSCFARLHRFSGTTQGKKTHTTCGKRSRGTPKRRAWCRWAGPYCPRNWSGSAGDRANCCINCYVLVTKA